MNIPIIEAFELYEPPTGFVIFLPHQGDFFYIMLDQDEHKFVQYSYLPMLYAGEENAHEFAKQVSQSILEENPDTENTFDDYIVWPINVASFITTARTNDESYFWYQNPKKELSLVRL